MTQFASASFVGLTAAQTLQSQSTDFLKHPSAAAEFNTSSANTVFNNLNTTSICRHIAVPPSADYSVSCDLVWKSSVSSQYTGVAIRIDPTANTMYFGRYSASIGWQLYKSVAGTATQLGSSVAETFTSGTKNLKVVAQGTTISLYNEGEATPVITATDSSITAAGYAGIRGGGAGAISTTGIHITNFSADTLDAGPPDATATGGTGAGAGSGSGGDASGAAGGEASASGGSGSGTGSGSGGDAAGTSSGSFTTSPMYSSGILQADVSASWTWYAGTIGVAPAALVHGAGANSAAGTLTATGLPTGSGFLLAKTADGAIYYEAGTVV